MSPLTIADEVPADAGVRSSAVDRGSTIRIGNLVLNLKTSVVSVDDKPVRLTDKEYSILELLSLRQGITVTKEMLLGHLYGGKNEPEQKIIDVFVCYLRKKLAQATGGEQYIETVWGRGYRLRDPALVPPQRHSWRGGLSSLNRTHSKPRANQEHGNRAGMPPTSKPPAKRSRTRAMTAPS